MFVSHTLQGNKIETTQAIRELNGIGSGVGMQKGE